MDQNDKNNKNRRGNRNLLGAVKLVAWALALTVVFYCTNSYMGTAGKQASSINIKYSDFVAMTEARQVEDVTVDSSEGLCISPRRMATSIRTRTVRPTQNPRIRTERPFIPIRILTERRKRRRCGSLR